MELDVLLIVGIFYALFIGVTSVSSDNSSIASSPTLTSFIHPATTSMLTNISSLDSSVLSSIADSITPLSVFVTSPTYMPELNTSANINSISTSIMLDSISNSISMTSFIFSSAQKSSAPHPSISTSISSTFTVETSIHTSQYSESAFMSKFSSEVVQTSNVDSTSFEPTSSAVYQSTTSENIITSKPQTKSKKKQSSTAIIVIVFFVVLITVLGVVCYRRRKKCGRLSLSSGGVQRASYQRFTDDDFGGEMHMTII